MAKALKGISTSNKLPFYYNAENIKNQDLVNDVTSCYKSGNGVKVFALAELFNLIYKQVQYLVDNCNNPQIAFKTLTELPLTAIQKHILYFNIIKWFGGVYNMNPKLRHALWLIENEFKRYKANTPEKDFYFKDKDEFERLTFKQINELKVKFDQLSYSEKLKFWDDTFGYECGITFSSRGFYSENDIEEIGPRETINPEYAISIYPKNKTETEQHNFWLLDHIQKSKSIQHCSIELLKENYYTKVKNNPRAIEYTEIEIESINKQKEKDKKLKDEKRQIRFWGYYFGYQSVVMQEQSYLQLEASDFKSICVPYAKGIADAHFLGFLENQLEKLKNEKKGIVKRDLPLQVNTDTSVVNGKKFYRAKDYRDLITAILELDPYLEVKDFLDLHYSEAGFTPGMSRINWFTKFRKALFDYGFSDSNERAKDSPNQIKTAFSWEREKSANYILSKYNKQSNFTRPIIEQKTTKAPETLEYTNKENYFFADKLAVFEKIEAELLLKEYIDVNGKWNKEKRYLVALIHILYNLKYLRPHVKNKDAKNTKLEYRRLFEKRYKTDITQEMKPSLFPPSKIKEYKFDFHFIPEIDKI